jgi:uncharacterized membrane protein (DUF373 family)
MAQQGEDPERTLTSWALPLLGRIDRLLYLGVAVFLVSAAVATFGYAIVQLPTEAERGFAHAVARMVNEALLVLIILELLGTVRDYLSTGTVSVRVFLYVGIISAIRRIVAIGAITAVGEEIEPEQFKELAIDLGVNAAVVLALAIALYLIDRRAAPTGAFGPAREAKLPSQAERDGESVSA